MSYQDPEARRAYARDWMARRRAEWFAGRACRRCGSTSRLEVHHRDGRAKVTHRLFGMSRSRRDAELAKCDVLCAAAGGLPTETGHAGEAMSRLTTLVLRAVAAGHIDRPDAQEIACALGEVETELAHLAGALAKEGGRA